MLKKTIYCNPRKGGAGLRVAEHFVLRGIALLEAQLEAQAK